MSQAKVSGVAHADLVSTDTAGVRREIVQPPHTNPQLSIFNQDYQESKGDERYLDLDAEGRAKDIQRLQINSLIYGPCLCPMFPVLGHLVYCTCDDQRQVCQVVGCCSLEKRYNVDLAQAQRTKVAFNQQFFHYKRGPGNSYQKKEWTTTDQYGRTTLHQADRVKSLKAAEITMPLSRTRFKVVTQADLARDKSHERMLHICPAVYQCCIHGSCPAPCKKCHTPRGHTLAVYQSKGPDSTELAHDKPRVVVDVGPKSDILEWVQAANAARNVAAAVDPAKLAQFMSTTVATDSAAPMQMSMNRMGAGMPGQMVQMSAMQQQQQQMQSPPGNDIATQLQKLAQLHQQGVLSDAEYAAAKQQALGMPASGSTDPVVTAVPVQPVPNVQAGAGGVAPVPVYANQSGDSANNTLTVTQKY